jgi:ribosomal protein S8
MVSKTIVIALHKLREGIKHRSLVVVLPKSRLLLSILQSFYRRNLISGFKVHGREVDVILRYRDGFSCVIKELYFECYKKNAKTKGHNFCTFLFYQTSYGGVSFETVSFSRQGTGGMLFLVVEV